MSHSCKLDPEPDSAERQLAVAAWLFLGALMLLATLAAAAVWLEMAGLL